MCYRIIIISNSNNKTKIKLEKEKFFRKKEPKKVKQKKKVYERKMFTCVVLWSMHVCVSFTARKHRHSKNGMSWRERIFEMMMREHEFFMVASNNGGEMLTVRTRTHTDTVHFYATFFTQHKNSTKMNIKRRVFSKLAIAQSWFWILLTFFYLAAFFSHFLQKKII